MSERELHAYRDVTRRGVPAGFTTGIFAAVGLDRYVAAAAPLGQVFAAWSAAGVSAVRRADGERAFEAWYLERFGRRVVPALEDDAIASAARAKLGGEDCAVPLDLRGCSPFEQRVLAKAAQIARGSARPYGWLARELGVPEAARAVGNALGRNPVPLLVPCHRVVRSDYSVGGYVFGGGVKRALLEREGLDFASIEALTRRGFRYVGCDDGTFCLPTCGDVARRLDDPGYVGLASAAQAHAHGLVPCASCRPIAA